MNKLLALALVLLLVAQHAGAAAYCTTAITQIYVSDAGDVSVAGSATGPQPYAGWQKLCNLNGTSGSASVITCATWVTLSKQAQNVTNIITQTYYPTLNACSEIPNSFPYAASINNYK